MRRFVQALAGDPGLSPSLPATVLEQLRRLPDRYNVSVGQSAGLIFTDTDRCMVAEMLWGLIPSWEPQPSTRYSTQTARLEHAPTSRLYRRAWAGRRCVLPLNGYYKWDRTSTPRQPYFIQASSGAPLYAAALWSAWGEAEAARVLSFSVLTRANATIPAPLFPDGPCFLPAARLLEWMRADPREAQHIALHGEQPRLEAYAVSRRVANRKLDDYSLLEPLAAGEEFQASFDDVEADEDE